MLYTVIEHNYSLNQLISYYNYKRNYRYFQPIIQNSIQIKNQKFFLKQLKIQKLKN